MGDSVVFWYSQLESHSCGYCGNSQGSISHGMWAKTLTVEDYQNLIDRGWRRSGCYCYKPIMTQTCCPMFTIKCDVLNFQQSKSQKRVIKKFNKFLKDGVLIKLDNQKVHDYCDGGGADHPFHEAPKQLDLKLTDVDISVIESDNEIQSTSQRVEAEVAIPALKTGTGADPSKPPCKKAKVLRMERRKEKLLKRGMSLEKIEVRNGTKTLEEFLGEVPHNAKHKLKLELINTSRNSKDWQRYKSVEFALYKKYQMSVHNDPPEKCTMDGFLRFLVNSPLQITLERMTKSHKHYKLAAALFAKYQMAVHSECREECEEFQYRSFLVDSPLQYVALDGGVGFGSFHQLYWLDDKLIAVGVIDVLPKCVSAVYFFYDPDYRDLTLGTYGSLREVEFARRLHRTIPALENYYMGFYIHSCPKMRYKGKLTPSFLLCPETYRWVSIEKCLPKLEVSKYSRLDEERTSVDENACSAEDVDEIKTVLHGKLVRFKQYKKKCDRQALFTTIGNLIGRKCAKSLTIVSDY